MPVYRQSIVRDRQRSECPECHSLLPKGKNLKKHIEDHFGGPPSVNNSRYHRCKAPNCVHWSLQRSNLETHYKTHTLQKDKVCTHFSREGDKHPCEYVTHDPALLTRHRRNKHGYCPCKTDSYDPWWQGVGDAKVRMGGRLTIDDVARIREQEQATRMNRRQVNPLPNTSGIIVPKREEFSPSLDLSHADGSARTKLSDADSDSDIVDNAQPTDDAPPDGPAPTPQPIPETAEDIPAIQPSQRITPAQLRVVTLPRHNQPSTPAPTASSSKLSRVATQHAPTTPSTQYTPAATGLPFGAKGRAWMKHLSRERNIARAIREGCPARQQPNASSSQPLQPSGSPSDHSANPE
ncbi:unnamed protein product [Somion occarium]|uniref:C2H2-type domain-containing protein n=1 Tax=Somion occarium TaxID=3059160 RepID=A0ABP1DJC0_9APHY